MGIVSAVPGRWRQGRALWPGVRGWYTEYLDTRETKATHMGKNCEEKGEIILPSAAVIPLRNALVVAVNKQRQEWLDLAVRVHAHLKSEAGAADRKVLSKLLRGQRQGPHYCPEDFVAEVAGRLASDTGRGNLGGWRDLHGRDDDTEAFNRNNEVARLLVTPRTPDGVTRKIQAPKKKDLPQLLQSKTWTFYNNSCSVHINPKTRVLEWAVPRSKNAVDDAWASVLGRTLARELERVKWTRGTGGAFNYTDEYAQDAAMDHGYTPISISHAYGPLGERMREDRMGLPMSMRRKRR